MPDQSLISLAIVNIEWSERRRDYIDNFVPFVAACLSRMTSAVVALKDVRDCINDRFCIQIPLEPLRTIMGRVHQEGLVASAAGVYTIQRDKLSEFEFEKLETDALRQYNSLINGFREYVHSQIHEDWDEEKAERAILGFLQQDALPVLQAAVNGQPIQVVENLSRKTAYVTGMYVSHLFQEDPAGFACLETFVKGYMLTSVLYLPQITQEQLDKTLRDIEVYFDTPFLIHALGVTTAVYREAYQELITLLYRMKAKLRVFEHTLEEVRNVLYNLADTFEKGATPTTARDASALAYFAAEKHNADDIRRKAETLESELRANRITVVSTPPVVPRFTLDEAKLQAMLDHGVRYRYASTRDRDIRSISAINHIRGGQRDRKLERSRAVLITNNASLASVSKQYFQEFENYHAEHVPHCFPAHLFATLIWLRAPQKAPNLPRKLVQSACFAALNPGDELWRKYCGEVDRLRKQGAITEEAYTIAVHSNAARKALMEITGGEFAAFSQGTAEEVLAHAIESYNSGLKAQVEDQSSKLSRYQVRDQQIANAVALAVKKLVKAAIIVSEVAAAVIAVRGFLAGTSRTPLDWLGVVATAIILGYTLVDFRFNLTAERVFVDIELRIAARVVRLLTPRA